MLRDDGRVLILQPIPKNAGDVPAFVLPRGSRQYQDEHGQWVDARDVATGEKYAASLEPYARGLAREVEEEAGVTAAMLSRAKVNEMGVMDFQSRTKGVYPIFWFRVVATEADAAVLEKATPVEAFSLRWAALDEIKTMAAQGKFSAGYVPVIERALSLKMDPETSSKWRCGSASAGGGYIRQTRP